MDPGKGVGQNGRNVYMKKTATIALSVILAGAFMAGCGGKDDSSSKKADSDSAVSTVDESSSAHDKDESSEADGSGIESKDDSSESDNSGLDEDSSESGSEELHIDKQLIGKWQAVSVTDGGFTYTVDIDGIPVNVIRFIFNEDNTGTYITPEVEKEFRWSMKNGVGFALDINRPTDSITLKLKDGELIATEDSTNVKFKKVDEFEEVSSEPDGGKDEPAGEADAKYVGKWECSKLVIGDRETSGDEEIRAGMTLSQAMTFEFKADGTGESVSKIAGEYREQFQWEMKDGRFTIFMDGEEIPVEISGGELTVVTSASKISLRRMS